MATKRDRLDNLVEDVKRIRDELEVQIHLAAADAKDEWAGLEKKWQRLRGRLDSVGKVADDAAEDVGDALDLLGDELKKGYERIRKML